MTIGLSDCDISYEMDQYLDTLPDDATEKSTSDQIKKGNSVSIRES